MNDCCASSSSPDKATAPASAMLPSSIVRPGVTFPDWSVVASPAVSDALQAMVGSDHVLNRFGKRERAEIDVTVAQAADAVEMIATDGVERAMNTFN